LRSQRNRALAEKAGKEPKHQPAYAAQMVASATTHAPELELCTKQRLVPLFVFDKFVNFGHK